MTPGRASEASVLQREAQQPCCRGQWDESGTGTGDRQKADRPALALPFVIPH